MELKVYCDRMSQPARALLIFCKANGIEFEEVKIELAHGQHHSAEYAEVNPMKEVPAIVHGDFKLFESHAILIYLASVFPGVADHWYPADVYQRAKVHSVLDWHHSNLRRGSGILKKSLYYLGESYLFLMVIFALVKGIDLPNPDVGFVYNTFISVAFGIAGDPKAAAEGEKLLGASLAKIESFWLEGDGPFLLGNSKPTIADLALVCEITQLEAGDESDRDRFLSPHKRILKWVEDVKSETAPHFEEIHATIYSAREHIKQLKAQAINKS